MMNAQQLARRRVHLNQDLDHLVRIARRQARKAGRSGLSVASVKLAAGNAQFQPAYADRAYLSSLWSKVMITAKLERVKGRWMRTPRQKKHGGNLVALWREKAA